MMRKVHRINTSFAVALLALAGLAFSAPNASAATAAIPDTATISAAVHHKLMTLPWYGVFDNLAYQVNGSEVILSGQVISTHSQVKYNAAKAVKTIPGVTKVVNKIEVLPPSPFDRQIRRAEYRAIFSKPTLARYNLSAIPAIHIIVKNGHVTLKGVVINKMDRTIVDLAAKSVHNVLSVTNDLRVAS